jgi:hypothetical protein
VDKGAIISALSVTSLAGAFSLFNLLVTKDQKISEFRQAWIEDLRSDISELVAQAHLISGYIKSHLGNAADFVKNTSDSYTKINQASSRVRLRLNRKEPLHQNVMKTMDELEKLLDIPSFQTNQSGFKELNDLTTKLLLHGADLLKAEWERVKTGETLYRIGKWMTGSVLFLSFLALLYVIIFYHA